jgi:hypothetical protein
MMPATPGRQTHDYIRHGTTSLFAALDMVTGKVIGQAQRRHRYQEFLRFLKTVASRLDQRLADRPCPPTRRPPHASVVETSSATSGFGMAVHLGHGARHRSPCVAGPR